MSTQTESSELLSTFERLTRQRDLYLFLPFMLGFGERGNQGDGAESQRESREDSSPENSTQHDRVIFINPITQGMVVIEGAPGLEAVFQGLAGSKDCQPPASKESVDAMPRVEIEEGDADGECAICMDDWVVGDVARDMPCKHRFHGKCIEEWLKLHGTCPVCRYKMPADDESRKKREIWVSFSVNRGAQTTETDVSDQHQNAVNGDGAIDGSVSNSNQETEG